MAKLVRKAPTMNNGNGSKLVRKEPTPRTAREKLGGKSGKTRVASR